MFNQKKVASQATDIAMASKQVTKNDLIREIKSTYYSLWLAYNKQALIQQQDSIFARFEKAAILRHKTGQSNLLEKVSAQTALSEITVKKNNIESDIQIYQTHLQTLLNGTLDFELKFDSLKVRSLSPVSDSSSIANNPNLEKYKELLELSSLEQKVEKAKLLPEFSVGYFNLSLNGPNQDINGNAVVYSSSDRFSGFMIGVGIPLWTKPYVAHIKAANLKTKEANANKLAIEVNLNGQWRELMQAYNKTLKSVNFYQEKALPQAQLMLSQFDKSFKNGAINYVEYLQGLNRALAVQFDYLESVNQHNQTVIQIEALAGLN